MPRKTSGHLEISKGNRLEETYPPNQRQGTKESVTVVNFETDDGDSYQRSKHAEESGGYNNLVFLMLVYIAVA